MACPIFSNFLSFCRVWMYIMLWTKCNSAILNYVKESLFRVYFWRHLAYRRRSTQSWKLNLKFLVMYTVIICVNFKLTEIMSEILFQSLAQYFYSRDRVACIYRICVLESIIVRNCPGEYAKTQKRPKRSLLYQVILYSCV